MNEFEWRRQLRDLRKPVEPPRDLWPRIDAQLDTPLAAHVGMFESRTRQRQRRRGGWLAAATLAGVFLLGGALMLRPHQAVPGMQGTITTASLNAAWKPGDPRFAGAAIEIGSAQMELRQALQQAPRSTALQRLLERTQRQEARLRQMERQVG